MKPAQFDIEIKRGDDYELFGRVRDRVWDEATQKWIAGDYKDITGWVGKAQYRASEDAVDPPALEFTVTLTDQVAIKGGFFVRATHTQTAALTVLSGKWDLQFTTDTGSILTYLAGAVVVTKDVTR